MPRATRPLSAKLFMSPPRQPMTGPQSEETHPEEAENHAKKKKIHTPYHL